MQCVCLKCFNLWQNFLFWILIMFRITIALRKKVGFMNMEHLSFLLIFCWSKFLIYFLLILYDLELVLSLIFGTLWMATKVLHLTWTINQPAVFYHWKLFTRFLLLWIKTRWFVVPQVSCLICRFISTEGDLDDHRRQSAASKNWNQNFHGVFKYCLFATCSTQYSLRL